MIRVMLVDDSIIIRTLLARMLKTANDIDIVSSVGNGQEALNACREAQPDIILLDLEMPVMDGLTALPRLVQDAPQAKIILCSAMSEKGADITLRGLALGASDFVLKPSALTGADNKDRFREQLLERIYFMCQQKRKPATQAQERVPQKFSLRADVESVRRPALIAIGSSTGGPNALSELFRRLKRMTVPIVITQHMPRTFTKILAEQLGKVGETPCFEAEDGMVLRPGHAYVAPGDRHMLFVQDRGQTHVRLSTDAPENFCRPAVDPMMRSLVSIYRDNVLAVILTGMGSDGLEGCRSLVTAGGHVFAQDEGSSVVWGMPGAVARAGLCTYVDNIENIAKRLQLLVDKL
jgi:two-component system chemotaxis response regulator CheB